MVLMDKKINPILSKYIFPLLLIITISLISNFFSIDKNVINQLQLWDIIGRPYRTFLNDLNLPHLVRAIFISGSPEKVVKAEDAYKSASAGDIFISQLRSLLFGTKITEYSIASYINFVFCISGILFSLITGYLIFKNGYISILIFILIVLFRNFCPGLIYGLPMRHAYAVFNPLIYYTIITSIIIYLKTSNKKYPFLFIFLLSGFILANIAHIRISEWHIAASSLFLFITLITLEEFKIKRKEFKKRLINILIIFIAIFIGYFGYYKMISGFICHRNNKFNFSADKEYSFSAQQSFHMLYISLFRYDEPNMATDKTAYDAVFKKHPEFKNKFINDVNYVELTYTSEYYKIIKELYFEYIFNNPLHFLKYLAKSTFDYFLFLPYYSWTGNKSAHAYLPKINKDAIIEPDDLAPFFKDTPLNLIMNLRLKYLPKDLRFWIYFILAYILLIQAIYVSFIKFRKTSTEDILLLRGMLIYFLFASIVRTLIPVHGQGAVVAFNIIIIYNFTRIITSLGNVKIPSIKIPALNMPIWLLILPISSILIFTKKQYQLHPLPTFIENFEYVADNWIKYKSEIFIGRRGQTGNCIIIRTTEEVSGGYVSFPIPVEIGEKYSFTAYFKTLEGGPPGQIKIGEKENTDNLYYSGIISDTKWTKYSGIFTPITTHIYITLVNLSSYRRRSCLFDTIILAPIE